MRENGFSPTDIEKVFFWPIFSRRLSPPAVPGNSYGRRGESSVLMLSLKAPKNKKLKIFDFLIPPTWPKVQLIAIQRPKSLKDYFLESRFMAACKNSANSNGGVARTRRGVFILNTYRSTPYLERRADGAPPPVLTETGCTSSGHLGGRRGSGSGVCPESGVFNLVCSTIWVFRFTLVHLLVIWQCPPGTEFGDDLYNSILFQFIRFSRGLQDWGQEITLDFGSSVWAFCGDEPHKNCSQIFLNFWEKFHVQKIQKLFFSILGLKIMQIDLIWSQGYGKTVFLTKN